MEKEGKKQRRRMENGGQNGKGFPGSFQGEGP
jgi:hypothetical protein